MLVCRGWLRGREMLDGDAAIFSNSPIQGRLAV